MYIRSTLNVVSNKFHAVLGHICLRLDFLWLVPGTACRGPIRGAVVQSSSLSLLGLIFLLHIKNGSPYVAAMSLALDGEL